MTDGTFDLCATKRLVKLACELAKKYVFETVSRVNFINVLRPCFSYKILVPKNTKLKHSLYDFLAPNLKC